MSRKKFNPHVKLAVLALVFFLLTGMHMGGCGAGCLMVARTPLTPFIAMQEHAGEQTRMKELQLSREITCYCDKNKDGKIDRPEIEALLKEARYPDQKIAAIPAAEKYGLNIKLSRNFKPDVRTYKNETVLTFSQRTFQNVFDNMKEIRKAGIKKMYHDKKFRLHFK